MRQPESSAEQLTAQMAGRACLETAVIERPRFDALLSELSTQFMNLPASALDHEITYGLQRLAECLDGTAGHAVRVVGRSQPDACHSHLDGLGA